MRNTVLLSFLILLTLLCTSYNADNATHSVIDSSPQKDTNPNPTITLNCRDFELGYEFDAFGDSGNF